MVDRKFGRLIPQTRIHETLYSASSLLGVSPIKKVETTLWVPSQLMPYYDQGETNGCVGYSGSLVIAGQHNWPQKWPDPKWLYNISKLYDNDDRTTPEKDEGAYIWAAMYCLQHFGHQERDKDTPDPSLGISSYHWAQTVDEVRSAIGHCPRGLPVVLGIGWYETFSYPELVGKDYWIGRKENLGKLLGGHAIYLNGATDRKEAFRLKNTWGDDYPPEVLLPYTTFERLMNEGAEACIITPR